MRVLTVRQPWAWAIIYGGKDVENRVRSLGPYRGLVAIHAGIGEYVKGTPAGEALKAAHGTEVLAEIASALREHDAPTHIDGLPDDEYDCCAVAVVKRLRGQG